MVVNYGLIRAGQWDAVRADVAAVSSVTRPAGVLLKVILETGYLDVEQIYYLAWGKRMWVGRLARWAARVWEAVMAPYIRPEFVLLIGRRRDEPPESIEKQS